VFLWKDTFYVIRLNEYNKLSYQAFIFDPNQSLLLTQNIVNGDDINADINRPEETARRVFTEFNAYLGSLIVAPSTVISLHINNTNAITAGDITFYIYADPLDPGIIFDPLELITKEQHPGNRIKIIPTEKHQEEILTG
jgi:hypothetical protein